MSGIQIKVTGDLPVGIPLAAEFGPGYVHVAVSDRLTQQETVAELASAWQGIREEYGLGRVELFEAS